MKILLESEFLQFRLLTASDFLKFLNQRGYGLGLSLRELEYYDKKGILRPALRLHLSKRNMMDMPTSSFAMKNYYNQGFVEFPEHNDFIPWKHYGKGSEKQVEIFYHPFQFIPIRHLMLFNNILVTPSIIEETIDYQKFCENLKGIVLRNIEASQRSCHSWSEK